MASTSARQQLVQALPQLFADQVPEFRGIAALEINQLHDDVAAGLLNVPEEDRRAAIMAAVCRGGRGFCVLATRCGNRGVCLCNELPWWCFEAVGGGCRCGGAGPY
jgi:hypothetical protein